ncbi:hypothetical protein DFH06DRAFT_1304038 [Mycena polygramma]|nr:hypothetical protein DFH06DRAFT_1304038 [Mycena polygramma]
MARIHPEAPIGSGVNGKATSQTTDLVNQLLKGRYSARYFLPDKISRVTIEDIVDAANNAPSGNNMQPWKVYCISGDMKDTISAEMVEAEKNGAPYAARYAYYPRRFRLITRVDYSSSGSASLAPWGSNRMIWRGGLRSLPAREYELC